MFPAENRAAAKYWLKRQPEERRNERPRAKLDNNVIVGFDTPYEDRLVSALWEFIRLTPPERDFVILNIERGIPWKGEPLTLYRQIVEEAENFRSASDKGAYLTTALNRAQHQINRMQVRNQVGENAYYHCRACGIELVGDDVSVVPAGRTTANGVWAPCPDCGTENSLDRGLSTEERLNA